MDKAIPEIVYNKEYGTGNVLKIASGKIYVAFGNKQRIFGYPGAFENMPGLHPSLQ